MNRLERLKSDLKDCTDPKVLAKYPHLGDPKLIAQLQCQIEQEEKK